MSTIYNANGTLPAVTKFTPVAIVSSTLATPIQVTATGHGFTNSDTVRIAGHDQLAANGLWQITYVNANAFTLNGSVGAAGAGGAFGTATDLSVNPLITIPADGDLVNASSVNVALEGTFNVLPFFFERAGTYRIFNRYVAQTTDDGWTAWSTNASLNTAAWVSLASATGLIGFSAATGDIIDISCSITGTSGGVPPVFVGLGASFEAGAYGIITGSAQALLAATAYQGCTLRGLYTVPQNGGGFNITGSAINLGIMGYGNAGSPPSLNLIGHRTMIVTHYRSQA